MNSQLPFDPAQSVFVSIDIQPRKRVPWTEQNNLDVYRESGFSLEELNAGLNHLFDVAVPAAVRVSKWSRAKKMPRVFVHWAPGSKDFLNEPRVHDAFNVRPEDWTVSKTQMDGFPSSRLAAVLKEIGRGTLLMVGGHTRGCLGETAKSALAAGYRCVLVRDASYDCSIKRWPLGIAEVPYHAVVDSAEVLG